MIVLQREQKRLEHQINKTKDEKQKQILLEKKAEVSNKIEQSIKIAYSFENMTKSYIEFQYCNPKCIGTKYESGSGVSDTYLKRSIKLLSLKDKQQIIKLQETLRKEHEMLFGNETNVLAENFHKNLTNEQVKKMKSSGALSGCIQTFSAYDFEK